MRLIDADSLLVNMDKGIQGTAREYLKFYQMAVNDEHTAYDVDKVVERLEELREMVPVNRLLDDIIKDKPKELGQLMAYRKAIEVVKSGGIK